MKRIALLLLTFVSLYSCKEEHQSRTIKTIDIQEFNVINSSIRAIHALDTTKVFYAGSRGDVGFKTNEGVSLNALNITYSDSILPHFRSLAFNGKDYFALSISNPALLYKIADGEYTLVYKEAHEKVFYDAMTFFDDNLHGIAVGDPTDSCASIIITSDGGESWKKLSCENLPVFEDGEAFFAASNTNIKTIGSTVWIASGGKKARILKSTDFGKTWQIYNTPIIQGDGPQGIYSVDFYDENTGIIIGGNYSKPLENKANKAITKDGGKTWTLVADNENPNYKSAISYVPNSKGKEIFAVGKTGISYSKDGGLSWVIISNKSFYAITFVDQNNAWLSGNNKIGKFSIK